MVPKQRILWTLYAINFLTSVGMWFFLPLLPIFLGRRGGSAALVGVVFAAGLLANALVRYPAGWAADRFGTRLALLVAMLATALLFLVYLLPLPIMAFIAVRLVQGAAQGAYWPAANGLLAEVTDPNERGRAFGYMQSTNIAGLIIGPGIGGLIALLNLGGVFVVAAVLSVMSAAAVAFLPNVRAAETVLVPTNVRQIARRLIPLMLLGAGTSYMIGTYDTVWSLYMTHRGGNTFAVGLSFVAFGLPALFASGYAGALADKLGARRLILLALLGTGFFAAVYPFVTSVPWLIGLGLIEGIFTISGTPAMMAEVSRMAERGQHARTQGLFQSAQTGIQIIGAVAGGALFTVNPTYAFLAISATCVLSVGGAFMPSPFARPVGQTAS